LDRRHAAAVPSAIHTLLHHRDSVIDAWQRAHPQQDVYENRNLELTGYLPISVDAWMTACGAMMHNE